MVEVWLPYGETEICVDVPAENFAGSLEAKMPQPVADASMELQRALQNPLASARLRDIVKSAKSVCIAVNDRIDQWPLSSIVEALTREVEEGGVDSSNIKLLVGSDFSRPNVENVKQRLGESLASRLNVNTNDENENNYVEIGSTSQRTRVLVNRDFAESDVKVAVGALGFHSFLGYCGGPEDLLSATVSSATIQRMATHAVDPNSSIANLEQNRFHSDASEVARMVGCSFHMDAIVDEKGGLIRAVAGSSDEVFREGTRLLDDACRVAVERRPEIVIVSSGGMPHDANFYAAHQSVDNITPLAKEKMVVVLAAECSRGHGDSSFLELLSACKSSENLRDEVKKDFSPSTQAALRWMKIVERHRVLCVSTMPEYLATGIFRMKTMRTLSDALEAAFRLTSRGGKVLVVPRGYAIVPYVTPATTAPQKAQG